MRLSRWMSRSFGLILFWKRWLIRLMRGRRRDKRLFLRFVIWSVILLKILSIFVIFGFYFCDLRCFWFLLIVVIKLLRWFLVILLIIWVFILLVFGLLCFLLVVNRKSLLCIILVIFFLIMFFNLSFLFGMGLSNWRESLNLRMSVWLIFIFLSLLMRLSVGKNFESLSWMVIWLSLLFVWCDICYCLRMCLSILRMVI